MITLEDIEDRTVVTRWAGKFLEWTPRWSEITIGDMYSHYCNQTPIPHTKNFFGRIINRLSKERKLVDGNFHCSKRNGIKHFYNIAIKENNTRTDLLFSGVDWSNYKICMGKCGRVKTLDEFSKNVNSCKKCISEKNKKKPRTDDDRKKWREWMAKTLENPDNRTIHNIRNLIRNTFKRNGCIKDAETYKILKCDKKTALEHLGPYKEGTHIDHIIPIYLAKYWPDVKSAAYALSCIWNLRRISKDENMEKGNSLPKPVEIDPRLKEDAPLAIEIYENALQYQIKGEYQ